MSTVFIIMLAIVLIEHFICSTILGKKTFIRGNPFSVIWAGITIMFVLSVAVGVSWLVYNFIFANIIIQTVVFILVAAVFTWLARLFVITKYVPAALHQNFDLFGLIMMINCSVLSLILIVTDSYEFYFLRTIIHVAFSIGGFTLAIMVIAGIREKLKFANPPSPLKGIPIAIIAAGLVAMVFFAISL